jgi:hypothetical protein
VNPLGWIADEYEAHCLTLAKGMTGRELLLRLGGDPAEMFVPQDEDEANEFLWSGMKDYWTWGAARVGEANGWAFSLEPASLWGSITQRLERASGGTEAICCFKADGMEYVEYWQDGALITRFETMAPHRRAEEGGVDPDRLAQQMRQVGLLGTDNPCSRHPGLALLHELTGVVLSRAQTVLALTGQLPAQGLGPEAQQQDSSGGVLGDSTPDAWGGPVGGPLAPRPAGRAKTVSGRGTCTGPQDPEGEERASAPGEPGADGVADGIRGRRARTSRR